jgi:hypothetical protein
LKLAVNHIACLDQSIPRSFLEFHQPPCRHRENKSAQTKIRSSRSKALEERGKYHEKESSVHLLERAKYGEVRQAFWQNGSALAVCASAVEQEEEIDRSSSSSSVREKRVGASHGSPRPETSPSPSTTPCRGQRRQAIGLLFMAARCAATRRLSSRLLRPTVVVADPCRLQPPASLLPAAAGAREPFPQMHRSQGRRRGAGSLCQGPVRASSARDRAGDLRRERAPPGAGCGRASQGAARRRAATTLRAATRLRAASCIVFSDLPPWSSSSGSIPRRCGAPPLERRRDEKRGLGKKGAQGIGAAI